MRARRIFVVDDASPGLLSLVSPQWCGLGISAMRVASFVLPTVDNNGEDLHDVHFALKSAAVATFGGFTSLACEGGWNDSDSGRTYVESRRVYQFAMPDDAGSRAKLESFARFYGHLAAQLCVMVTHATGDVVFVDCHATVDA
jgi:hypothetical protein